MVQGVFKNLYNKETKIPLLLPIPLIVCCPIGTQANKCGSWEGLKSRIALNIEDIPLFLHVHPCMICLFLR